MLRRRGPSSVARTQSAVDRKSERKIAEANKSEFFMFVLGVFVDKKYVCQSILCLLMLTTSTSNVHDATASCDASIVVSLASCGCCSGPTNDCIVVESSCNTFCVRFELPGSAIGKKVPQEPGGGRSRVISASLVFSFSAFVILLVRARKGVGVSSTIPDCEDSYIVCICVPAPCLLRPSDY